MLGEKKTDYGKAPELEVSKIIENHNDLTKCLEKKTWLGEGSRTSGRKNHWKL